MGLNSYLLGDLITQRREKNPGIDVPAKGVSSDGFIDPKQPDADTHLYNVFYRGDFVFNPARMELNSIAFNRDYEVGICSSLYEVFYVNNTEILLPEYLNLFIKRDEFARLCKFIGWGSAREYCRVSSLSGITMQLPSIDVQRKYAAIYESMLANQRSYEQGLNDLKVSCDALIERLMREVPGEPIGPYIEQSDERNRLEEYGTGAVRGISTAKVFIETVANLDGVSLANYKVVYPCEYAYVADTSRRGNKVSLAFNDSDETYITSAINTVFRVKEEARNRLLPAYLMLFFGRSEFDRYARFCSWGSARETFSWEEMRDVRIPLPDIAMQRRAVNLYQAWQMRSAINERLKWQLKDICPVLIRGSIEEASR